MNNILPQSRDVLFTLGAKAADGLNAHESTIGVMHHTEALTRANLSEARENNEGHRIAVAASVEATRLLAEADDNAAKFIMAARDVLKPVLGSRYSAAWSPTGFSRSLAVPGSRAKRLELVNSLRSYLDANPGREVAALNVTHDQASTLHTALSDADNAATLARREQRAKRAALQASEKTLRERLRGLIAELRTLIGPSDLRWLDFGFNIPNDERAPEEPMDLVVAAGTPGHLVASWSSASRAERYHVYKQVVGENDEFVLAATVEDTDADLNTFASGVQVRVRVAAVNDRGEGVPSEIVAQTVP